MKKNIIIVFLVLTNLFTIIYGMVKVTQIQVIAERNKVSYMNALDEAEVNSQIAKVNADSAQIAVKRAELEKRRAEVYLEELEKAKDALAKCK